MDKNGDENHGKTEHEAVGNTAENKEQPMPVPVLNPATGFLQPGVHNHTLAEISAAFATTPWRKQLFQSFENACHALWAAGVEDIHLAGSYVSAKPEPGDLDGIWTETPAVQWGSIPPILQDFTQIPVIGEPGPGKFDMWHKGRIELWVHPRHSGGNGLSLLQLFSQTKDVPPQPRGIILVTKPPLSGLKGRPT